MKSQPHLQRQFTRLLVVVLSLAGLVAHAQEPSHQRLNILLFTADDLGYEAFPALGGSTTDVTPNLDRFAKSAMSFEHAHVNVAICAPSRSVIATGRYSHNSGCIGFNKMPKPIPTVFGTLRNAGYLTGILGKVDHSTTDPNFRWDFAHDYGELGSGRSPSKYYNYCTQFFEKSRDADKPFYLMVNSHDPHRPFYTQRKMPGEEVPTRIFSETEITVPTYLADLPNVRKEIAMYFSSIRRLDDTFGKVMDALEESGMAKNTLVLFMTDNGSAFPFAKANTYLASTRTPCFVRWPGVTRAGSVDRTHLISEVDFFPTFMEATGVTPPEQLDGRSIVPILQGKNQPNREYVFTQIDYTISGPPKPMRCVQDKRYGYIFNAFSDGKFQYRNNNEGSTFRAMQKAGKTNPAIQERVDMFRYRVPQEFYDLQQDPGCVNNLINSPEHQTLIKDYQDRLRRWMVETNDHCLTAFDVRDNPEKLAEQIRNYRQQIKQPRSNKKKRKAKATN
ncbi:sulfatase family protein [Thalassoroseus pseudoceratinae]|uniref:sulfatase family protein n=1 Tax=Thalassoroseus pseudoceratinae TaxID=2713176 RepID=UPI00141DB00A|nr:sulfatase [Thalassoroseus pseudoceratinae]